MREVLQRAVTLREAGDLEGILALCSEHPDDPEVLYQCAWTHDKLGRESEAVQYYEWAIEQGLEGEELRGAYVGLGSTYRCLGRYHDSLELLSRASEQFPDDRALKVFSALAYYNLGRSERAMEILLTQLLETTGDERILAYGRALHYYADKLDKIW